MMDLTTKVTQPLIHCNSQIGVFDNSRDSDNLRFADVPLTLLRGFLDTRKGIVELRLRYIAIHYVPWKRKFGARWVCCLFAAQVIMEFTKISKKQEAALLMSRVSAFHDFEMDGTKFCILKKKNNGDAVLAIEWTN